MNKSVDLLSVCCILDPYRQATEATQMNTVQIIEALVAKLTTTIQWRMQDMEDSYEEAKAYAQERSVAGCAVWEIMDKKFSK